MKHIRMLLIGVLIVAGSAGAQTELTLSVEKAIQLALDNNKSLHASLMRLNFADARASEVHASRLPSLKFSGSYTRLSDVPPFTVSLPAQLGGNTFTLAPSIPNYYGLKTGVEMPLFTGFRLSAAADAAEYSAKATEQLYANDKAELAYNVRAAYWSLFKAMEFKKVFDENVEQVKSHLKDVQNFMNQGMATNNDVLKVQVQLSDAMLRQIEADNNVQLATIALNNTMGIPLETKVIIESRIDKQDMPQSFNLNDLTAQALEQRSELKAMDYRVKAAEAGVTAAKGNWWPQMYLAANYYYNRPNQRLQPTQDIFKDTWDISLGVSLDIWNWGKTLHQTDQAAAQYEEVKDGLSQLKDGITLEVTQNYLNVHQAQQRITLAEEGVRQAEESHRVTSTQFKEGLAQNTDLLDAEVALLRARTQYTQAIVDYELAQASLHKAVGE